MSTENSNQPAFRKEAEEFADRIIALEWRENPVKSEIAGDWEAGYVFGFLDGEKRALQSPKQDEQEQLWKEIDKDVISWQLSWDEMKAKWKSKYSITRNPIK